MQIDNLIVATIIRGIVIFILALFLTRLIGRKLISQMTFFDFVVGVSMGSIAANAILGPQITPLSAVIAMIVISLMAILAGYLHIKSIKVRKLVNSEPVVVIQNGTIIEQNLRKIRLTLNELMMKLREKNAFNFADVEYAIMETDGQLSVFLKSYKQPLTPSQMNIQTSSSGLTKDIIMDGKIIDKNLAEAGFTKEWLNTQLRMQNIQDVSEVFYGAIDNTQNLFISKKMGNGPEAHGQYGLE